MMTSRNWQPILKDIVLLLLVACLSTGCSAEARKKRHLDRAQKYFASGEYEKAKLEYFNVLRADQQNSKAFARVGTIWWEEGAALRAAPFLVRACDLAPADIDSRLRLARVYVFVGGVADARKEAATVLRQSPANGEALMILAEASRNPEDLTDLEGELHKFPDQNTVAFHLSQGTLKMRRGDVVGAEAALRAASGADPKSSLAHSALAALYLYQKNRTAAGDELKLAADLAPPRSIERTQHAEFLAQAGSVAEATAALKALTAQAPDYLPAWRLLAQISIGEKKYDEALTFLEKIFAIDPDNLDGRMVEVQARTAKGEGPKVVEGLRHLDKTYPKIPAVKLALARAYLLNNNPPDAAATLNDALAMSPEFVEAKMLLGEVKLRTGDAPGAAAAMTELLKARPGFVPAQVMLADAYRLLGKLDDAADVFREQIKIAPLAPQPYLALGIISLEQKKPKEARAAFEKAIEMAPGTVLAIDQLIELDIAEGALGPALQKAQKQVATAPTEPAGYVMLGKVHFAAGRWDEAEAACNKALELNSDFSTAYDLLIRTYLTSNRLPEAIAKLEAGLARTPGNLGALMMLALTYEKTGDYSKARDNYEKLLAVKSDFIPAINNLAFLYAERLNQLDRAAELAQKARTLQPTDPAIADTLGWITYKRGDPRQAFGLLQESAAKLPDAAEIQYHLGMAAYAVGQTELARTSLTKAVESTADFLGKDQIRPRLALLGDESGGPAELSPTDLETLLKQRPDDPVVLRRLAETYDKAGEAERAADIYERAVKVDSKLLPAVVRLAQLYAGPLHDKGKAISVAKKARELAPTDPRIAATLGKLAFEAGNHAWAYSLLQASSRQLTDDVSVLRAFAWAAYSVGKVEEAQRAMFRVQESSNDPVESEDAKTFLSLSKARAGDTVDSEALAVLKKDPNYVPALMVRAALEIEQGASDSAQETYKVILAQYPDFAPAQRRMALLYGANPTRTAEAYDLAMKARKSLPDDPELAQLLGQLSYLRKDFTRALQLLLESGRKRPLDAVGKFYLGLIYLEQKQFVKSTGALREALDAGLPDDRAQEARRVLAELQTPPQ